VLYRQVLDAEGPLSGDYVPGLANSGRPGRSRFRRLSPAGNADLRRGVSRPRAIVWLLTLSFAPFHEWCGAESGDC
jgi:hypothetical protein